MKNITCKYKVIITNYYYILTIKTIFESILIPIQLLKNDNSQFKCSFK